MVSTSGNTTTKTNQNASYAKLKSKRDKRNRVGTRRIFSEAESFKEHQQQKKKKGNKKLWKTHPTWCTYAYKIARALGQTSRCLLAKFSLLKWSGKGKEKRSEFCKPVPENVLGHSFILSIWRHAQLIQLAILTFWLSDLHLLLQIPYHSLLKNPLHFLLSTL